MRIRIIALAIPLLAAACSGSSNATTGEEFLEKFQEAVKEKEAKTIWKMLSKNTQSIFEANMTEEIKRGYWQGNQSALLQEFEGVKWREEGDKDLRKIDPEILYLDRLQRQLDSETAFREFRDYSFVEEKAKGKGVLLVVKDPTDTKISIVLAREDDYLKYDQELTERNAKE